MRHGAASHLGEFLERLQHPGDRPIAAAHEHAQIRHLTHVLLSTPACRRRPGHRQVNARQRVEIFAGAQRSLSASPRLPPLLPLTKTSSGGHRPVWPMSDGNTFVVSGTSKGAASSSSFLDDDAGDSSETARWNDGPRVPRRAEAGDCDGESPRAREVTLNARARRRAGRDGTARGAAETVAAARTLMVRASRRVKCRGKGERGNRLLQSAFPFFVKGDLFRDLFCDTSARNIDLYARAPTNRVRTG